jgi:hypothetical protein
MARDLGMPLTAIRKLAGHASIKMTLRYAHLSPRYLADEVKALDRVQQTGKPTTPDADQPPAEREASESESAGRNPGEDAKPTPTPGSLRRQQPVKGDTPGQPMHGIGKVAKQA